LQPKRAGKIRWHSHSWLCATSKWDQVNTARVPATVASNRLANDVHKGLANE
jgi:hypothetical protein